ncbi:MAG: flippase-like domain-containing protein, partial [Clostridia bacterium]|nr:flippase-like domain-containing protein [Clostridia bacterium]
GIGKDPGLSAMLDVMALNSYATFASSVVPTPGNSGAIEGVITMAFSYVAPSILIWVVMLWRMSTFYLYIVLGVLVTLFDLLQNMIAKKKGKNAAVVVMPTTEE